MPVLGREVLGNRILKRKALEVPEWGGVIFVRELTGREAIPISQGALEISQAREKGELSAEQVVRWHTLTVRYGWINEDGSYVLGDDDMETLMDESQDTVERIADEIRALSGMKKKANSEQVDQTSAVADAKKNSTLTAKRGSGTGSR